MSIVKTAVTFRKPYADGCEFNPRGVVCRDKEHDCSRCGWFPAEEKRRKLERLATGKITVRRKRTPEDQALREALGLTE